MPWEIRRSGDKWCVYKEGTNKASGCHETYAKARAQQKALYASETRQDFLSDRVEDITDEQFALYHSILKLRDAGILDEKGLLKDLNVTEAELNKMIGFLSDAKLSAERRKKLSSNQFCGPNKSFPVPDCPHVTAALRLLNRAKLTPDQKARVKACVLRKQKTLGCKE